MERGARTEGLGGIGSKPGGSGGEPCEVCDGAFGFADAEHLVNAFFVVFLQAFADPAQKVVGEHASHRIPRATDGL